jgi:hypothetical protein
MPQNTTQATTAAVARMVLAGTLGLLRLVPKMTMPNGDMPVHRSAVEYTLTARQASCRSVLHARTTTNAGSADTMFQTGNELNGTNTCVPATKLSSTEPVAAVQPSRLPIRTTMGAGAGIDPENARVQRSHNPNRQCCHKMECPPNDHPFLILYRQVSGKNVGVNKNHGCVTGVCTYWSDGKHSLFICRVGLHIHRCGRHSCSLSARAHTGEFVCPVSGYCHGSEHVHYATRDASDRFVNSITWTPSRKKLTVLKRTKVVVLHQAAVGLYIQRILKTRKRSSCRERMLKGCLHQVSFQATIAAVIESFGIGTTDCSDPIVGILATRITEYIPAIRKRLRKPYTDLTLVAVIIQMLTTGLAVRGVTIFPIVPYVVDRAPAPVAYALVPGIQCRAMSHATRAIRAVFLHATAIPPELVFPAGVAAFDGIAINDTQ